MDLGLKDKVVLVTGGYRGLGKAICLILAEEGAKVGVNHRRSPQEAERLIREMNQRFGVRAAPIVGDVTKEDDVASMFDQVEKQLGPAEVLVNNAAYCPVGATAELSLEEFQSALGVKGLMEGYSDGLHIRR